MSRVQLALNVNDIGEAVSFYTKAARYGLSRAMSSRWRTFPRTPAAAVRSARPTATFSSTWLSPWQAAGTVVTVT